MRGEHTGLTLTGGPGGGSSPHARGARLSRAGRGPESGIIPACAGSTSWRASTRRSTRDHPRMRGEHVSENTNNYRFVGSSPHARGARLCDRATAEELRIIPACAGSTVRIPLKVSDWRDHPRMRGEHAWAAAVTACLQGSSPHARGAPGRPQEPEPADGIIPACAGSTTA